MIRRLAVPSRLVRHGFGNDGSPNGRRTMPAFVLLRRGSFRIAKAGGPDRIQTGDLFVANEALYQLSYWPVPWRGRFVERMKLSKYQFSISCAS
jgi:hypothetical protein